MLERFSGMVRAGLLAFVFAMLGLARGCWVVGFGMRNGSHDRDVESGKRELEHEKRSQE